MSQAGCGWQERLESGQVGPADCGKSGGFYSKWVENHQWVLNKKEHDMK